MPSPRCEKKISRVTFCDRDGVATCSRVIPYSDMAGLVVMRHRTLLRWTAAGGVAFLPLARTEFAVFEAAMFMREGAQRPTGSTP